MPGPELMDLGFTPGRLFRLVMYESLWLGLVGLVVAALITAWPFYYLATTGIDIMSLVGAGSAEVAGIAVSGRLYAFLYPEKLAMILAAVFAATLLSGVFPALRAGRVNPVETIRLV